MNINKMNEAPNRATIIKDKYHIVTFAETGFAMLNIYAEYFGIDRDTIEAFSEQVNQKDESGSLHPKAPISVVPRRYIRDLHDETKLESQLNEFLKVNQSTIKAKKILFDFRAGVDKFVVTACESAVNSKFAKEVDEVIIINKN